MKNRPFLIEDGLKLQWHPGNLIERVLENKCEIGDFQAVLLLKWLRVTNYTQDVKCDKIMELLINDHFGG